MSCLLDITDVLFAPTPHPSSGPLLNALDLACLACVCRALRPLAAAALQRRPSSEVALDCLLARDLPRVRARIARALDRARARAPTPFHPLPHFIASIRYTPVGEATVHLVYNTQRHGHGSQAHGSPSLTPCIDLWNPRARAIDVLHPSAAADADNNDALLLRRHPFFQTPCFRTQTFRVCARLLFLPADLFDDADANADAPYPFRYPRTHVKAMRYDDAKSNWTRVHAPKNHP